MILAGWWNLLEVRLSCHIVQKLNYFIDFRRRFLSLLSYKFRDFGTVTALSILEAVNTGIKNDDNKGWHEVCYFCC